MEGVSEQYGRFGSNVRVAKSEVNDAEHRLDIVENELLDRTGITKEFLDCISWKTCTDVSETETETVYHVVGSVVWNEI